MLTRTASHLAMDGGKSAVTEPLRPFNTISSKEAQAAYDAVIRGPLSGYLGGELHGGYHVEKLERAWEEKFQVKHAVACNSATAGIFMACQAAAVKGKLVRVTPYTMSGSVAPAAILGANIIFGDITADTFCLKRTTSDREHIIITTNLFGHPHEGHDGFVIEDAAQSILATRDGKYMNADIAVFSGNVHKAVQCGEGGMCCTNSDMLADTLRLARNHAELTGCHAPGLNLRLTEVQAAIWYVQLKKARSIIDERVAIAEELSSIGQILGAPQRVQEGCFHSFYIWSFTHPANNRDLVVRALRAEGVPVRAGYVTPLYKFPAFQKFSADGSVVEQVESELVTYENCAWSPTKRQLKQIKEAFEKVADAANSW